MSNIKLTIHKGLRLHFCLDVGYLGRWLPGRLNNKEKMILHLIKDLKWRVNFLEGCTEGGFFMDAVELEAEVDGDLAESLESALKALMRMRMLRKEDLERLKAMPMKDACRELTALFASEG